MAICRILKRLGFAVSEAATCAQALAALNDAPEWILLDLMLPDGCGIDVIKEVQTRSLVSKICIITGCDSDLLVEAHSAGAAHTFIKPLNIERLMSVMTSATT